MLCYFREAADELKNLKIDEACKNSNIEAQNAKSEKKSKGGKVTLKCPKGMRDYTPDQVILILIMKIRSWIFR